MPSQLQTLDFQSVLWSPTPNRQKVARKANSAPARPPKITTRSRKASASWRSPFRLSGEREPSPEELEKEEKELPEKLAVVLPARGGDRAGDGGTVHREQERTSYDGDTAIKLYLRWRSDKSNS